MASNSTALATKLEDRANGEGQGGQLTFREALQAQKEQIALALPRQVDPDRFLRLVLTTCRTTPKLLDCSFESIMGAVMQSAQLGLEPGPLGHAYFVPYGKDCQFIIGYQGYLELFNRGGVTCIARKVCENDEWTFWFDEDGDHYRHVPAAEERGRATRWYAVATLPSGQRIIHVMSRSDIDARRKRSKARDSGPWSTDFDAMAAKTVVRDLARWIPKSVEFAEALAHDDRTLTYDPHGPTAVVTAGSDQPAIDAGSEWDDEPEGEPKEALI